MNFSCFKIIDKIFSESCNLECEKGHVKFSDIFRIFFCKLQLWGLDLFWFWVILSFFIIQCRILAMKCLQVGPVTRVINKWVCIVEPQFRQKHISNVFKGHLLLNVHIDEKYLKKPGLGGGGGLLVNFAFFNWIEWTFISPHVIILLWNICKNITV